MIGALLATMLLAAAQPAESDGPVSTAVPERPGAAEAASAKPSTLDEEVVPPKGSKPVDENKTAPAAVAAAKTLTFEPKTLVQGDTLQVLLGQRAVFRLDSKNLPVLVKVEEGKLAAAHPP